MIDFIYIEDIEEKIKEGRLLILAEEPVKMIKGLALDNKDIIINLSAVQWKKVKEPQLIREISKTIIHENLHLILLENKHDKESEERIVRIMMEQKVD